MSLPATEAVFDVCRERLEDLLDATPYRADFTHVEHMIDAYPLSRDEKAALWLWAAGRRHEGGPR